MTNFVFIGDVHSQYSKFSKAVEWIDNNIKDYHIIQGGDLFDSRTEESDSVGVYNLVKSLGDKITVIHSNHHWKLYQVLSDPTVQPNESIGRTLTDFSSCEGIKEELIDWISTLPYGVAIKDNDHTEYRICHAYWPSKLYVPPHYEGIYKINTVSSKSRGLMIYGIGKKGADGERISWWNDSYNNPFVRVSFHYHAVSMDIEGINGCKHLILDGSCGDDNGQLLAYVVNSKNYRTF